MKTADRMPVVITDGGRAAAGFRGTAGDCVARAIAIASGRPYQEVYDALAAGMGSHRARRGRKQVRSARNGVNVRAPWFKRQMAAWGFTWTATVKIGTGCKVHLAKGELPMGRLVVRVTKHVTAVIDGVVHDTYDPQAFTTWFKEPVFDSRDGVVDRVSGRCVYGYWIFNGGAL